MEFGRVPEELLNGIDFRLEPESLWNKTVLLNKPVTNAKVYIGCAKWGREEWIGKIYPPKTKEKDFLQHYIQHYNCIELNATHYKIYGEKGIEKWAAQAMGKDFLFCPKMYKGVTHFGGLGNKKFLTDEFLRGIAAFKEHLGPIFIQVSDSFSPNRSNELFSYLQSLPKDIQFFVEMRHASWFTNENILQQKLQFLSENNIGFVITDTAGRRACCHMQLTIPKAFIRFVGNSLHATDYTRIDAWVQRIHYWLNNGLNELYFFMHMHNEATSPELTVYLVDKINEVCKFNLVKPIFYKSNIGDQQSLF